MVPGRGGDRPSRRSADHRRPPRLRSLRSSARAHPRRLGRRLRELADALGLDRFGVVACPAGGIYVAACAATIPERVTAAVREAVRQRALGWSCEGAALMAPWNFWLADISMPVHIWYGEQELPAYRDAAEFAAETIPDARVTGWPDAGHRGVAKYWREILEALPRPAR